MTGPGRLFVGTSGFSYPDWAPSFYPPGLRANELLPDTGPGRVFADQIGTTYYRDFIEGRAALLYVAPERFANARFVAGLRAAGVHLLVIDEAHCISEWGHDFRPDYLVLGSVRGRLGSPRTLALTATADPVVRRDILVRLGIVGRAAEVVTSFDRPNLRFEVVPVPGESERIDWIIRYARERRGQAGIVYARTRRNVEQTERDLKKLFPREHWNALHLRIIYYGREHCTARGCDGTVCEICRTLYPQRKPEKK